jgi:hypothetical protein
MPKEEIHEKELSPMKGWRTKWEWEKNVLQDIVKELQSIQKFEDKSLELLKHNKLEPTKLQSYGLSKDAPLKMSLPQDDSPSGSWLANMTKERGHLGNQIKCHN